MRKRNLKEPRVLADIGAGRGCKGRRYRYWRALKTPSEQAREQAASNSRAINDENSGIQGGVRDGRRLSAF